MIVTAEKLLTAEEFGELPDDGQRTELVKGRVVSVNMPYPRHGQICMKVGLILAAYVEKKDLGHVLSNDAGVITQRSPDTVRGADIAYYSFQRVPRGPLPRGYLSVVPELIVEVKSLTDRWPVLLVKVGEYLNAGVTLVCILDEQTAAAYVYTADEPVRVVNADAALTLPEVFEDFSAPVSRFFE